MPREVAFCRFGLQEFPLAGDLRAILMAARQDCQAIWMGVRGRHYPQVVLLRGRLVSGGHFCGTLLMEPRAISYDTWIRPWDWNSRSYFQLEKNKQFHGLAVKLNGPLKHPSLVEENINKITKCIYLSCCPVRPPFYFYTRFHSFELKSPSWRSDHQIFSGFHHAVTPMDSAPEVNLSRGFTPFKAYSSH